MQGLAVTDNPCRKSEGGAVIPKLTLRYTYESLSGAGKPLFYRGFVAGPPNPVQNEKKMPKLKTHTGAKKRFSKTGTGKIKRHQTKTRHILSSKSPKVKRKLGKMVLVSDGDYAKVARMIPYA
jgi:large subunit ribosomal protein L35